MPSISRESLGTAYFHVIVQGIAREYIFKTKENIEKYRKQNTQTKTEK